jgi:hypothetical protein
MILLPPFFKCLTKKEGIPIYFLWFYGVFNTYLRFLPNKKVSADLSRDALGFLGETVLKTFLNDSTI